MKKRQSETGRGWFQSMRSWFGSPAFKPKKRKASRCRPTLETLEDRTMLTVNVTFLFIGRSGLKSM